MSSLWHSIIIYFSCYLLSSQGLHKSLCFIRFDGAERSSLLAIKLRCGMILHIVPSQNLAVFYLCSFPESQPLQGVWVSASGYDTDAFNKAMQPPSGKTPYFTRTFMR